MTRGTRGSAQKPAQLFFVSHVSQVLSANVSILKTCLAYLGGLHVIWLCYGRSMVVSGEDWMQLVMMVMHPTMFGEPPSAPQGL